jgi:hypothetical protein
LQEFEDLEEDVNNLGDDCVQTHLTKEHYERSQNTEQLSNKISRMDIDQAKEDQFVKRGLIRNPNPQIQ